MPKSKVISTNLATWKPCCIAGNIKAITGSYSVNHCGVIILTSSTLELDRCILPVFLTFLAPPCQVTHQRRWCHWRRCRTCRRMPSWHLHRRPQKDMAQRAQELLASNPSPWMGQILTIWQISDHFKEWKKFCTVCAVEVSCLLKYILATLLCQNCWNQPCRNLPEWLYGHAKNNIREIHFLSPLPATLNSRFSKCGSTNSQRCAWYLFRSFLEGAASTSSKIWWLDAKKRPLNLDL